MVRVGFEDGSCLNSPPRGVPGLSFSTPRGAPCLSCPPRGAPGLSFLTTGGFQASVSQSQEGSGPQFPHPTANARWIRLGAAQDLIQQHRSGAVRELGGTLASLSLPGAVTRQRSTHGHPTPEQL